MEDIIIIGVDGALRMGCSEDNVSNEVYAVMGGGGNGGKTRPLEQWGKLGCEGFALWRHWGKVGGGSLCTAGRGILL